MAILRIVSPQRKSVVGRDQVLKSAENLADIINRAVEEKALDAYGLKIFLNLLNFFKIQVRQVITGSV